MRQFTNILHFVSTAYLGNYQQMPMPRSPTGKVSIASLRFQVAPIMSRFSRSVRRVLPSSKFVKWAITPRPCRSSTLRLAVVTCAALFDSYENLPA